MDAQKHFLDVFAFLANTRTGQGFLSHPPTTLMEQRGRVTLAQISCCICRKFVRSVQALHAHQARIR